MKLSPNFSLEELTRSDYAARHGLDNTPDAKALENLKRLAELLEQVRAVCNTPIVVSSGYRAPVVNAGVGGSKTSQHMLGCAADIRALRMSVNDLMRKVVNSTVKYDQIIKEFDSWVHISIPNSPTVAPRKQALIIDRAGTRPYR